MKTINYLIIYLFIITILWVFTPISAAGNDNEAGPSNKTIYNRAYREKLKEKGENIDKTSFKQIERIYCPTGEEQKKLINYYKDPKFQEARRQREINKSKKSIFEKIEPKLWIPYIRGLLVLHVYGEVAFVILPVDNKLFQKILLVFKFSSISEGRPKHSNLSDEIVKNRLQILKNQIDEKMYSIEVTAESVKNVYEFNGKKLDEHKLEELKQVEEEEKQQQRENNSGLNLNEYPFDLNEQPEE